MPGEAGLDYETSRVAARPIVLFACGFAAFAAMTGAGLTFVYRAKVAGSPAPAPTAFPQPSLQTDDRVELRDLTAAARQRLGSYLWIDPSAGLVHLPVEEAMKRVVARGAGGLDPVEGAPRIPSPAREAPSPSTGDAPL